MTRYPAQPARDAVAAYARHRQLPISDVAIALGVDRSTLLRLHTRDWLRYDAADHIAVALGKHPSELWTDWFAPDEQQPPATLPHQERTSLRTGRGICAA